MPLTLIDENSQLPAGAPFYLEKILDKCLALEGVTFPCQTTLLITNDDQIQTLNRNMRGKDAPTDVISFPVVNFKAGTAKENLDRLAREKDPETRCVELGDIALSAPRAAVQASEYGHTVLREICFLYTHGVLHLLGHDHKKRRQRDVMCYMEEQIMKTIGITRESSQEEKEMLDIARHTMDKAYAPYSAYRVGACVRTPDGSLFYGCNVENASYGLTICAERSAIASAVANGHRQITAITVVSEGAMPYPCGACRQFLREFAMPDTQVTVSAGLQTDRTTLDALLPKSFGPESINGAETSAGVSDT